MQPQYHALWASSLQAENLPFLDTFYKVLKGALYSARNIAVTLSNRIKMNASQRSRLHKFTPAARPPSVNRRLNCTPQAFLNKLFSPSSAIASKPTLDRLLQLTRDGDRGLATTPQQLAEIKECFETLEASGSVGTESNISGTWKLLWTTEKVNFISLFSAGSIFFCTYPPIIPYFCSYFFSQETLFILKNASWFGTQAGEVYQVIDTSAGSLQNIIEFPPEGAFIVDSSLDWVGEGRTEFKFNGATISLPDGKSIKLPPFGQGWFKSVYVSKDGKYRLSRDVRNDYLIAVKQGPPRKF